MTGRRRENGTVGRGAPYDLSNRKELTITLLPSGCVIGHNVGLKLVSCSSDIGLAGCPIERQDHGIKSDERI